MTWDVPYHEDPRPNARHNIPHGNLARIQIDAMVDVTDQETDTSERYVLIAPCRWEWVYAEDRLFQIPSAEYRNAYSLTRERSFGRRITTDGKVQRGRPVADVFRSLKIDVRTFRRTHALVSPGEIVQATANNEPLVARTHIESSDGRFRYVMEYPIKTMNFQPKTSSFQVDTGPILMPDLKNKAKEAIDRLEMAHVAYNRLDRAEFIVRRPTPIAGDDGKELCRVLHYSEVHEHTAVNELLKGDDV